MASYYVLLTDHGKSFLANIQADAQLALTHVVLGDANDQPYLPESRLNKTALLRQRTKLPVTSVKVVNATTAEVTALVPSNIGGFNVHEVGITDSSGKLVYVGNFHGGYRPTLTDGAGGDMELVFTIKADNLATVVIEMDSTVVTASRDWVTEHFVTKSQFQEHLDASDPHDQYALKTLVEELRQIISQLDEELMATQYQLLSERLTAIEGQLDEMSSVTIEFYKVGDIYQTTIDHATATDVATHHGYGTWARYAEGRTLVGLSKQAADPADYKTMGKEFGENEHTLTVDETPRHTHKLVLKGMSGGVMDVAAIDNQKFVNDKTVTSNTDNGPYAQGETVETGGSEHHNNIQPSKVVGQWVRTA